MALKEGQSLDLNTLQIIEAPKPEGEKQNPESKDEVKDESSDDPDGSKPEGEVKDQPEAEADKEVEADKEEEEKPEEEKEEKKDEAELDLDVVDDYLAQQFEEKYGIKNEEDLAFTLEAIKEVEKENADLRKQLEEAKSNVTFESEQEQKAFEFLKKYPISKMGDGMAAYARLVTLDVEAIPSRVALEEKFVLEHDELTREEALHKFNRDFDRKYKVKASSFETQEEADAEQKDLDIDLKSDAAKAKKFLAKQQEEFKSKITDKSQEKESAKSNQLIQESVRTNLSELNDYLGELETLTFTADDGSAAFNYKFTRQQKELISASLKNWIGNPNSYEANGKFRGEFNVESHAIQAAAMLFHEDMIEKALSAGQSQGEIKRADQIAQRKPNRESKVVSGGKGIPVKEEDQWDQLAKERKKKPVSQVYK